MHMGFLILRLSKYLEQRNSRFVKILPKLNVLLEISCNKKLLRGEVIREQGTL